jgi:hypothetical protein
MGVFVNDAKREIEDAYNWNCLTTTIVIPTVAGTRNYTLTGSGQRFRTDDVLNDTQDVPMRSVPTNWMNRQYYIGTTQNASPIYYNYSGISNDDTQVDLWPQPDGVYSLRFELVIPQVDLSANADLLKVPPHLVQMLAYAKAVGERGEDGGSAFSEIYQQYRLALADAIAIEKNRYEEENTWIDV